MGHLLATAINAHDKAMDSNQRLHILLIMCVRIRDGEDLDSQGEGSSQPDTISLASRTSQNTLDSDKVSSHTRAHSLKDKYDIKVAYQCLSGPIVITIFSLALRWLRADCGYTRFHGQQQQ